MTEFPVASEPAHEPDVVASREPRHRRTLLVGVIILGLLTFTGVGYVVWREAGDDKQEAKYPDEWNAKVLPFVKIVEKLRGLKFEHPVYVDFLTTEVFDEEVPGDRDVVDVEDEAELKETQALFVSMGLISPEDDLVETVSLLAGTRLVAAYDTRDERIRMRGEHLLRRAKVALVHELTHALQDQHFDLSRFAGDDESESRAGLRALAEADAFRIHELYVESLDEGEIDAITREIDTEEGMFGSVVDEVPVLAVALYRAPYSLGVRLLTFAQALTDRSDNSVADLFFKRPPSTQEDLLDPHSLFVDRKPVVTVEEPMLERSERRIGGGALGASRWLYLLGERLPALDALTAIEGWAGDQYVRFERANHSCVRVAYRADTPESEDRMYDALTRWRAASPRVPSTLVRKGDGIEFATCEPPASTEFEGGDPYVALIYAEVRTSITSAAIEDGVSIEEARCFADGLLQEFTQSEFIELVQDHPELNAEQLQRRDVIGRRCLAG